MEDLKKSFLVRGNNIVGFGGSGEENTIDSISVNGVNITPDENKNVDITVPNIYVGDTEPIEDNIEVWFNPNGESSSIDVPIESIKVNGKVQTPVDKVVDIIVPDAYDDTALSNRVKTIDDKLGTTDISSIDDGTVTGAIKYINEKVFKSVSDGKILIADAITDKGVPTSADATFAIMANNIAQISASSGNIASGEFTTASTSQGIVNIDCGFRPDVLLVFLPISSNTSGYTTAYYAKTLSTKYSIWCLHPTENMTYTILLGSASNGESGIQNITDTGFAFRCNASNTQNRKCTYIAYKSV